MKYIVVLADGMSDYPIEALGYQTPLQYARTPNMDLLAKNSEIGLVKTIPDGLPPGSDVANLSVMGYDPRVYYTGRSPLEAISMGVDLQPEDVAFRCNLVTLSEDPVYGMKTMVDYSSDEITSEESHLIMEEVKRRSATEDLKFYPGVSYRHLLVWRAGPMGPELTPPHDISDQIIGDYLPKGPGSSVLLSLMKASYGFLPDHPVNIDRVKRGLRPANSLWFWGLGKKPVLPSFRQKYGLSGSVISAVDLTRGLGICAGLAPVIVPGATGNITTDFRGKAQTALKLLHQGQDFVYIHIEAPDEAGHRGELETKIRAIEEIDEKVLGELLQGLKEEDDFRIMLLPDHPTPLRVRTHVVDEVPYLIYQENANLASLGSAHLYNEETARKTGRYLAEGHLLMDHFVNG